MRKWEIFWQISRSDLQKSDGKYVEIPDRREAIEYSLSHAEDGDIIAIIGKGAMRIIRRSRACAIISLTGK